MNKIELKYIVPQDLFGEQPVKAILGRKIDFDDGRSVEVCLCEDYSFSIEIRRPVTSKIDQVVNFRLSEEAGIALTTLMVGGSEILSKIRRLHENY